MFLTYTVIGQSGEGFGRQGGRLFMDELRFGGWILKVTGEGDGSLGRKRERLERVVLSIYSSIQRQAEVNSS